MDERGRRLLFLLLFAVAIFQTGVHASQAFINYPAWRFISAESFLAYHQDMTPRAGRWGLLPRLVELLLGMAGCASVQRLSDAVRFCSPLSSHWLPSHFNDRDPATHSRAAREPGKPSGASGPLAGNELAPTASRVDEGSAVPLDGIRAYPRDATRHPRGRP